jgi:hypothetical protein
MEWLVWSGKLHTACIHLESSQRTMVGRLEGTKQAGLTVAIWDSKDSVAHDLTCFSFFFLFRSFISPPPVFDDLSSSTFLLVDLLDLTLTIMLLPKLFALPASLIWRSASSQALSPSAISYLKTRYQSLKVQI